MKPLTPFIIACTSRSGSAWMSAALSMQPGVLCRHEGIGRTGLDYWQDASHGIEAVGSCGGDALSLQWLSTVDPSVVRVFYLFRNPEACKASLERCGVFNEKYWQREQALAFDFLSLRPIILYYDDLRGAVATVMEHLHLTLDWDKLEEALRLRVTSNRYPDSLPEI